LRKENIETSGDATIAKLFAQAQKEPTIRVGLAEEEKRDLASTGVYPSQGCGGEHPSYLGGLVNDTGALCDAQE